MRLSLATRLKNLEAARVGLLHSASELKLTEIGAANLEHCTNPTVERNGWSSRKLLENDWSLFDLRLKADPMSAKPARLTVSPIIGIRYSKFPSICVSPPTEVNERANEATLLPDVPVNVPRLTTDAGNTGTGTI